MLNNLSGNLQANIVNRALAFDDGRAQVICAVLAGAALCQTPLLMDLTDGEVHHLLRLQGQELVVFQDCTPKQVMLQAYNGKVSSFWNASGLFLCTAFVSSTALSTS